MGGKTTTDLGDVDRYRENRNYEGDMFASDRQAIILEESLEKNQYHTSITHSKSRVDRLRTQCQVGSLISSVSYSVRRLQKTVGCGRGFSILVGIIFGCGIFISPSLVMKDTDGDVGMALLVWVVSGFIMVLGSLCYCELGTAIQKGGGTYTYIKYIYGPLPAFVFSWTQILIIDPTGVATVALTIGNYIMDSLNETITPNPWYPKAIASFCILSASIINMLSSNAATHFQSFFAFFQVSAVLFIFGLGIWRASLGHLQNLQGMFSHTHIGLDNAGSLGTAFYGALWAYNGWQYISNVTEEMVNVEKHLFSTVISASLFIIFSYVIINVSILTALTPTQMANSDAVALTFVRVLLGSKLSYIIPVLVCMSCYGACNSCMFLFPRVSMTAGREGQFPEFFGMISKRYSTPIPSVVLLVIIAHVFILPDAASLQVLINFCSIAIWVLFFLLFVGVIVLRFTQPNLLRPFKVWVIVPVLMVIISLLLVALPFYQHPVQSTVSLLIMLASLPVYVVCIHFKEKHPAWFTSARQRINRAVKKTLNLAPCVQ